uniref:Uncharacterized protein n=1 Tax=Plectus sambesii TaxID=2011161 RepID=A0A914W7W7_9BILA
MAKLVDSSACFLARIENSFWAKEVKVNESYTITRPTLTPTGVMLVGDAVSVCRGMAGGVYGFSAAKDLGAMLEAVDRRLTKRIATLKELGINSGLHSIRAKIMKVGSLRTVKTRNGTETNQLTIDVRDGIELTLWGSPAGATFAFVQLGGCFSFSGWWQGNSFAQ